MAKYKVAVIEMVLKNNKTAIADQVVTDDELTSNAEELLEKGFIKKLTKSDLENLKKDSTADEKAYVKMNKEQLHLELTKRKIEFDEKAVNADLVKLLEDNDNSTQ